MLLSWCSKASAANSTCMWHTSPGRLLLYLSLFGFILEPRYYRGCLQPPNRFHQHINLSARFKSKILNQLFGTIHPLPPSSSSSSSSTTNNSKHPHRLRYKEVTWNIHGSIPCCYRQPWKRSEKKWTSCYWTWLWDWNSCCSTLCSVLTMLGSFPCSLQMLVLCMNHTHNTHTHTHTHTDMYTRNVLPCSPFKCTCAESSLLWPVVVCRTCLPGVGQFVCLPLHLPLPAQLLPAAPPVCPAPWVLDTVHPWW